MNFNGSTFDVDMTYCSLDSNVGVLFYKLPVFIINTEYIKQFLSTSCFLLYYYYRTVALVQQVTVKNFFGTVVPSTGN